MLWNAMRLVAQFNRRLRPWTPATKISAHYEDARHLDCFDKLRLSICKTSDHTFIYLNVYFSHLLGVPGETIPIKYVYLVSWLRGEDIEELRGAFSDPIQLTVIRSV